MFVTFDVSKFDTSSDVSLEQYSNMSLMFVISDVLILLRSIDSAFPIP